MSEMLKTVAETAAPFVTAVASFVMAFFVALLRTFQQNGRANLVESIICGLLAIGVWSLLGWFGIPQIVAVGFASAIGYFGAHQIGEFVRKRWMQ